MRAVDWLLDKSLLRLFPRFITPNLVTAFRFLMIPVVFYFLWKGEYSWGLVVFSIAAFSDVLDGALARTRRQITTWGKLFDPLADKLLIGSTVLVLASRLLSWWLAAAMVAIELLLIFVAYFRLNKKGVEIKANWSGKIKMLFQCVGVILLIAYLLQPLALILVLAQWVLYLALAFGIISLVVYRSI